MRYLYLLLLLLTCCNSIEVNMLHRYNRVDKKNDKKGVWVDYYENGKLKKCVTYKKGKINGISINYFENGMVERIAHYRNGELHGIVNVYNDQGYLMSKSKYSKGEPIYIRSFNPY